MNDGAPWLERELARQLAPVSAPECLWARIHRARCSERPCVSLRRPVGLAVACVTLIVGASLFWRLQPGAAETLTARQVAELTRGARNFDFRSNDFGAIRSWVKTTADIDIDLPDGPASSGNAPAQLFGVRLLWMGKVRVAAIDYRVGHESATLLVCGKRRFGLSAIASKHLFSELKSTANTTGKARLVSWNMRNESYAIAFYGAGESHGACLLCHANMPGLIR